MVNKAIQDLVTNNFGEDKWIAMKEKVGFEDDFFISMQSYPDKLTYDLVGAASEIKNSILFKGAKAPHLNYVGDSIIGKECNLGSGTKIANLRLDKKEIIVTHRGERIDTSRRKLGVIMGDNVSTGINSSINSGTIIGSDVKIGPNALVSGTFESKSLII